MAGSPETGQTDSGPGARHLVLFVLYNQDDASALMEYRGRYGAFPLEAWVYPGGMVEPIDGAWEAGVPSESALVAACQREVREELGVRLLQFRRLAFNEPILSVVGTPTTVFLAFTWDGTLPTHTDRGDPLQWHPLASMAEHSPVDAVRRIAKRAQLSALRPPPGLPPGMVLA